METEVRQEDGGWRLGQTGRWGMETEVRQELRSDRKMGDGD